MPFTLQDAARLTQDMLLRGVIETIIEESAVLRYLPFVTVKGSGISYNQEDTLGEVDFYGVGSTWEESAMTLIQQTATLKILGGDADVDAFLQQTYANKNDIQALVIQKKAKATALAFNSTFFNGDSSVNTLEFDGVKKACAGARTMSKGANGAVLDLGHLDELIDMIKPGKPATLFMSKRTRRKLSALRRASGNILETGVDQFGRRARAMANQHGRHRKNVEIVPTDVGTVLLPNVSSATGSRQARAFPRKAVTSVAVFCVTQLLDAARVHLSRKGAYVCLLALLLQLCSQTCERRKYQHRRWGSALTGLLPERVLSNHRRSYPDGVV